MPVEHSTITDPDIHEPKGVAAANSGDIYVANGAGSGNWTAPVRYYTLTVELDDISTASSAYTAVPFAGTITKIYTVIHAAITTADETITTKINGTDITDGSITITQSGSAAGDVDSTTPSAANTVAAGDYVEIATAGSSGAAERVTATFLIQHT